MGEHPVARQKQEALACFLADDPTAIPIPTTEKVIASPAGKGASTLNKSFLAAVVASAARPAKMYLVGEGWAGEHHGGPLLGLLPGDQVMGVELGETAMLSEAEHGLQGGGREFHGGYAAGVYYVGYLLALRHGSPEVRKLAARVMAANLAVDYLLTVPGTKEVVEIGGRATGGINEYAGIIQRLWAGEGVRVPKGDAAIACQIFDDLSGEEESMLPHFPKGVEDAVEILGGAGVACPADLEWWGWTSTPDRSTDDWTGWRAQVNQPRSWFIDKRTGDMALVALSAPRKDERGDLVYGWPDRERNTRPTRTDWHLTLGAEGLQVHRRPGGEGKPPAPDPKPTPPPRPEEPTEPPDPNPDPNYLDEGDELAKALVLWGDEHGFHPARRLGREVRRAIHAEKVRLKKEGAHEE